MTKIENVVLEICALKKRIGLLERKYSLEHHEIELTIEPVNVMKTTKKAVKKTKKVVKK